MHCNLFEILSKHKSIWEIMTYNPQIYNYENIFWTMILENLTDLFRKDTFFKLVHNEKYYPQPTQNCRYYIKPNNGSGGKNIKIVNSLNNLKLIDETASPEILTPCVIKDGIKYKYDYRVWIGIKSDLSYYICPTLIKRVSNIPFDITKKDGSITNTSLYSDRVDETNEIIYNKINLIVNDVLKKINPIQLNNQIMLTGWDFIENETGDMYVLEVNPNPSTNIQHINVFNEFIIWLNLLNK